MAQKLTLKRNYNPRQYRDRPCDVRAVHFASCLAPVTRNGKSYDIQIEQLAYILV